jgi:tripartite-type tricarboxylate transporter receptor subunit TctC
MVATPANTVPLVKEGKLRALATLKERSALLPDVPTMREAGFSEPQILPWGAFVGPPRLPKHITEKLSREISVILGRNDVSAKTAKYGYPVHGSSPEELKSLVNAQLVAWRQAVRDAGIPQE